MNLISIDLEVHNPYLDIWKLGRESWEKNEVNEEEEKGKKKKKKKKKIRRGRGKRRNDEGARRKVGGGRTNRTERMKEEWEERKEGDWF